MPAHNIVRAIAVQLDGKDSSTGAYTRISSLPLGHTLNSVRINVTDPVPQSQIALILSIDQAGEEPLDTVFRWKRFLIREASP